MKYVSSHRKKVNNYIVMNTMYVLIYFYMQVTYDFALRKYLDNLIKQTTYGMMKKYGFVTICSNRVLKWLKTVYLHNKQTYYS